MRHSSLLTCCPPPPARGIVRRGLAAPNNARVQSLQRFRACPVRVLVCATTRRRRVAAYSRSRLGVRRVQCGHAPAPGACCKKRRRVAAYLRSKLGVRPGLRDHALRSRTGREPLAHPAAAQAAKPFPAPGSVCVVSSAATHRRRGLAAPNNARVQSL